MDYQSEFLPRLFAHIKALSFKFSALSSKKPFASKKALCFLLLALSFLACKFNPSIQSKGTDALQGDWRQDSVKSENRLVSYSLYRFRFRCDSVFVLMELFSKVNAGADSCTLSGHWVEYAKGVYDQSNDTIHVKGFYCNPNFSLKAEGGCFNSGVYEDKFKIIPKNDTAFTFLPLSSSIPVELRLTKRINCVPKAL